MKKKTYLTRKDTIDALKKMKSFHDELINFMSSRGFDILDNLGRRNILLSNAQEKFFSEVLSKKFEVEHSGKTGEPDIVVKTLSRELECKLTSPHKTGAIAFQTDYRTLKKKKSLDYLYVVADKSFDKFAVIHYYDLTTDDFRKLSTGARGKTQLMKHKASDKAVFLFGGMESINHINLLKLNKKLKNVKSEASRNKILKSIEYWKNTPTKYKIKYEAINES